MVTGLLHRMFSKIYFILFIVYVSVICRCNPQKVTYLEIQQPVVTFVNENHVKNLTVVSKRFGRNPLYFMTVSGTTVITFDEATELHFYAYEKFPDGFQRTFVENHVNVCDFINENNLFSKVFLPVGVSNILECPVLPGDYIVPNMTAPYGSYINALPFTEGRLYLNVTYKVTNMMFSAWANINIKEMKKSMFLKYIKEKEP